MQAVIAGQNRLYTHSLYNDIGYNFDIITSGFNFFLTNI